MSIQFKVQSSRFKVQPAFASIGLKTQDLKWKGALTPTQIGSHNTFREYVTVHSATGDGETTTAGSHNHILAYCHIAHNVTLGDHIIMSNVATLAGHIVVEDRAVIGGLAAAQQFCRIGTMSIIGGCSKVVQDVPPHMLADGNPAATRRSTKWAWNATASSRRRKPRSNTLTRYFSAKG